MNYYKDPVFLQYVSNSQLGDFKKAYYLIPERSMNLEYIYNFGNLVDAYTTDKSKLIYSKMALLEEASNELIYFEKDEWEKGLSMGQAILDDPMMKLILPTCLPQYVVLKRSFTYTYMGETITMPTRCKLDFLNKAHKMAVDVKSTSCTTYKSVVESMKTFNYFRQSAMYMDLTGVDKMWYVFVSKKKDNYNKYPVFKVAIQRGDDNYNLGKNEYNKLGFLYYHLIYNFQLPTLINI